MPHGRQLRQYNFVEIQGILKNNTEQFELPVETVDIPEHENIRGRDYYQ